MKHLLNDLSEEVKNSILEQHTGGMKVVTENFSKLLNTKSGTVRPLVSEQDNVEPRYKHRLGHQDRWYDEDDRVSDDFEDYDDEFEFGPDDYDSFTDMVGGFDNKWNPSFRKHYYDKYTETSPLKIRRKQMGMSEQVTTQTTTVAPAPQTSVLKNLTGQGTWLVKNGKLQLTDSAGRVVAVLGL
jgi:hypothetical protein